MQRSLISPNGSPWRRNVREARLEAFSKWADLRLPLVYVNQVGGQDEIAFDGESFAIDARGRIVQQLPDFEEAYDVTVWETHAHGVNVRRRKKS